MKTVIVNVEASADKILNEIGCSCTEYIPLVSKLRDIADYYFSGRIEDSFDVDVCRSASKQWRTTGVLPSKIEIEIRS